MRRTALLLVMAMLYMLNARAQEEVKTTVTASDKEQIAIELEREAKSGNHDEKTSKLLGTLSESLNNQKDTVLASKPEAKEEPQDKMSKAKSLLFKVGRGIGKGSAWVATTTAKPFIRASGFMTGLIEQEETNQDFVGLYQFFLNHSADFDHIYEEAGSGDEMIELFLTKMENIMQKKALIIIKDFLIQAGVKKNIPDDFKDWELTAAEIANLDQKKLDVAFVNNHEEYKEIKALVGEMTQTELNDIITSGYFSKSITFENYKAAMPKIYEGVSTLVGQIIGPKIALGIISSSLAGLYTTPVILADIGTGLSAAFCYRSEVRAKFNTDKELKSFCSYVTNRTSYELMKSRSKGYVSGKGLRAKINLKLKERRENKAKSKKPTSEPEMHSGPISITPA